MSQVIQYVRKKGPIIGVEIDEKNNEANFVRAKGMPYGCLIARSVKDSQGTQYINIGWSLCNKKDTFTKSAARVIATAKASICENELGTPMYIPHSMQKDFEAFCERVKLYFQTDKFTHTYHIKKDRLLNV